jgi:hypothetical protein
LGRVLSFCRKDLGAEAMTFAEYRRPLWKASGRAPRPDGSMRICHVTPHLPPDQAANALLPAELAAWAAQNGHEVTMVSHEPAQGRAAAPIAAGRVWRLPRKRAAGPVSKLLRWKRSNRLGEFGGH